MQCLLLSYTSSLSHMFVLNAYEAKSIKMDDDEFTDECTSSLLEALSPSCDSFCCEFKMI